MSILLINTWYENNIFYSLNLFILKNLDLIYLDPDFFDIKYLLENYFMISSSFPIFCNTLFIASLIRGDQYSN